MISRRYSRHRVLRFCAASCLLLTLACGALQQAYADAPAYYERYGLTPGSPAVDVGIQPLGYPAGVLTTVLRHDEILKRRLAELGQPLQTHPFQRGADMLALFSDKRLEAGLLGDMPTLIAAASGEVSIVGLAKQSPTAIVARDQTQVRGLAGKRIAYVEVSSAHQTLLQGLSAAGIKEGDVRLVPMRVDDMPEALKRGDIDAFAAWEPAPSIALAANPANRIVFRGLSSDYFVVSKAFVRRSPAAVDTLVAGYVRAIEWLRLSQKNIERAARWAQADAESFSGRPSPLPAEKIVAITRRELLNVPSAPSIINNPKTPRPLLGEFGFLKRLNKLPADGEWSRVADALNNDLLPRVQTDPRRHETGRFDYRD